VPLFGNKKPKFFYGYIIVIAGFLIMMIAFGTQYSFGVFFKPILNEFGWTRAETSGPYSLYMITYGVFCVVTGRLCDRFGPRLVVTFSGLISGLGYVLMSQISALWQLYIVYGIMAALGTSTYIPLASTIARWFGKRRGLMTGIATSGVGLGIAIVPVISTRLILSYDWRTAVLIVGGATIALIMLMAQFLRREPQKEGPAQGSNGKLESNSPISAGGLSMLEAIRTRQLWIICISFLFSGIFFQSAMVHIVPHVTDLGISKTTAASVLAVIGILGTVGRIGMGFTADRIGNKAMLIISFAVISAAFWELLVAKELWMFYLFAVLFGFFSGLGALITPVAAEYFGLKAVGAIAGMVVFAWAIGGAVGPTLSGYIFDVSNSYSVAFVLSAILSLTAVIILFQLKPIRKESL